METSICFTNDSIQAIYGDHRGKRIIIKKFVSAPLPIGAMINGLITDDRALSLALADFRGVNPSIPFKNVRLAISGSAVYTKVSVMPPMRGSAIDGWVDSEFSELENVEELIYDYSVLRAEKGKGMTVLLCAAPKELIKSYIDLFGSLNIDVSCIDIVQNCQIKLMSQFPSLNGATYIVLSLDGSSVDSALYSEGLFKLLNRTRLLSERGTPEYSAELERVISGMLQFQRSDRHAAAVSNIFAVGFAESDADMISSLGTSFGVSSGFLSDTDGAISASEGFSLCGYAYTTGNLIKK